MKRFLRLACLLLACLMVVGTLTACDITEVLDEMFQDDDHADRDDRYEDDEEETKKKPSQRPADTEAETDSLERPEETTQWGDTWGEVETTRPQPEDPFKDPFKDPVKDEPLSEVDAALKELEGFDFDGRTFGVLCDSSSYYEAYADNESKDGYAAQIINDGNSVDPRQLQSWLETDEPPINFLPAKISLEDKVRVWSAINKPYQVSLFYKAAPVFISSEIVVDPPRVTEAEFTVGMLNGGGG